MSAFRRRDIGHPFSAAVAAFWNFPGSAPGTFAATSRWIDFTVQPASVLSKFKVAFVSIRSGWYPSFSSSLDKAIEKQPACAAATSSSGFVPGSWSPPRMRRSEEHTSELQSLRHLVCRLLLEKKKTSLICVEGLEATCGVRDASAIEVTV